MNYSLILLEFNILSTKKAIIKQDPYGKVYNELIIFLFAMQRESRPESKAENYAKKL